MYQQSKIWKSIITGFLCLGLLSVLPLAGQRSKPEIDLGLFSGLKARALGPANMSGRISAVEAVNSDPRIIFVGAASGGVWKSINGGHTWQALFDDQPLMSVGDLAVFQANPDIVWVGTGESKLRNSISIGNGVYLSLDGGLNWRHCGLEKSEKISRIVLHPHNPDIAYVGVLGATWSDSPDRGVYKTEDRGRTWKRVLAGDQRSGVADLVMDPANPERLLAAIWEHRRWPWFFKSGGPGSGLYLSNDGGASWTRLGTENGLPKGDLGRIGLAFAPSRPQVVYALVEAERNVLLRSEDRGLNFQQVNREDDISNRPFYYSRIQVNPVNENILYLLASQLRVSEDGGRSLRNLATFRQAHPDFHAIWINSNGEHMLVGNDGGLTVSHDRGRTWRFVENLPLAQFYHVSVDLETPYNIYGGLQDNGTWRGPAYVLNEQAIEYYHWVNVGGGDGFATLADPEKPGAGYGMSQGGNLYYFDINLGTSRGIVPTESEVKHRYNWNAGLAIDPFEPGTIYLGSQFLHRSKDKGRNWEIISPDLTANDPEKQKQADSGGLTLDVTNAENHCTILTIAPSRLQQGLIWVGSDDGRIHLTRDGGANWQLVSAGLSQGRRPALPPDTWVPHLEASHHDPAVVYAVFDDHRRGNFQPYVFRSADYGRSWQSLAGPGIEGYCHVIREDPVNPDLLFLGTEFGLFVSFNRGGSWQKWSHDLPAVPVYDLVIHPREHDLVIGTHGRGIYVIDDIRPLREIKPGTIGKKLHLFQVSDAVNYERGRMNSHMSPGDTIFSAENKNLNATFSYFLLPDEKKESQPEEPEIGPAAGRSAGRPARNGTVGGVAITILDASGGVINRFTGSTEKGLNRVFWNFSAQEQAPPGAAGGAPAAPAFAGRGFGGIPVPPGAYTVKIRYGDLETEAGFEVKADPRLNADPEVLRANYQLAVKARRLTATMQEVQRRLQETEKALQAVRELARGRRGPQTAQVLVAVESTYSSLKELKEKLNPTPARQGIADRSAGLNRRVLSAVMGISRAGHEPVSQPAQVRLDKAGEDLAGFLEDFNSFYAEKLEALRAKLEESGFSILGEKPEALKL